MPETTPHEPRLVRVPFERLDGWLLRYDGAHPGTAWRVTGQDVRTESPDGTRLRIAVPFAPLTEETLDGLSAHLQRPWDVGVVLVRKGGFAVASLRGREVVESKIGRRHVQGRTKAGGWSQHRFARRRDNQARAAFDAAAGHVQRVLGRVSGRLDLLGTGGDRKAVASVLAHPELSWLAAAPQTWLGGVPDPNRDVLDEAVTRVRSVEVSIIDPPVAGDDLPGCPAPR
ncbi:MAG: hypothetical protein QOI06_2884 [Nocardioidaceae bacterium]|jgi:hypothetical protein|nr:hypothetical protein [Nocardioidaceae bacterium]